MNRDYHAYRWSLPDNNHEEGQGSLKNWQPTVNISMTGAKVFIVISYLMTKTGNFSMIAGLNTDGIIRKYVPKIPIFDSILNFQCLKGKAVNIMPKDKVFAGFYFTNSIIFKGEPGNLRHRNYQLFR